MRLAAVLTGWVLWSQFSTGAIDGPKTERWDIVARPPTYAACVAALHTAGSQSASMRQVGAGPRYRVFAFTNVAPGYVSHVRIECRPAAGVIEQ